MIQLTTGVNGIHHFYGRCQVSASSMGPCAASSPIQANIPFSRHKGIWAGKAYAKLYVLPPEFNPEVHKLVPGEDKASPVAHMAIDACPVSYGGYSGEERFSGKFPDDLMHMMISTSKSSKRSTMASSKAREIGGRTAAF